LGLINPLAAVIVAFSILGVMLYRHVKIGIALNSTAILLALLAVDWVKIPEILWTSVNPLTLEGQLTLSIVFSTFGVMWMSQLYKDTGALQELSESLGKIIRNPKIILSVLPAVVGLLPVPGGALMSAPVVDSEAERLKLSAEKKVYANLWFRHITLPIYPLSPVFIITIALTGITAASLIGLQIPIVAVMMLVGYITSFRGVSPPEPLNNGSKRLANANLKAFLKSFTPILATIVGAISIGLAWRDLSRRGIDVLVATVMGITILAAISKARPRTVVNSLRSRMIYDITLATYGAFLLRGVVNASGFSEVFKNLVVNGNIDILWLMIAIPTVFSFLTGFPSSGVIICASILGGILSFTPKAVVLIYMGAYLGYMIAPTHLCFTFTAEYFKTPLGRAYRQLIPSFIASFAAVLLLYSLPF